MTIYLIRDDRNCNLPYTISILPKNTKSVRWIFSRWFLTKSQESHGKKISDYFKKIQKNSFYIGILVVLWKFTTRIRILFWNTFPKVLSRNFKNICTRYLWGIIFSTTRILLFIFNTDLAGVLRISPLESVGRPKRGPFKFPRLKFSAAKIKNEKQK